MLFYIIVNDTVVTMISKDLEDDENRHPSVHLHLMLYALRHDVAAYVDTSIC